MFNIVDDLFLEEYQQGTSEKDKLLYLSRLAIINKSHDATNLTEYERSVLNGVYLVTRFVNENIAPKGLRFGVILSFEDIDEKTKFHKTFKKNNDGIIEHLDNYAIYPMYSKQFDDQSGLSNSQYMLFALIGVVKSLCNKKFYELYDQSVSIKLPHQDSDKLSSLAEIFREDFNITEDINANQDILLLSLKRKSNVYQKIRSDY